MTMRILTMLMTMITIMSLMIILWIKVPLQLLQAYDDFHAKYPDGEINKEQFMEVSKVKVLKTII